MEKKQSFKLLITEFQERTLPEVIPRELTVPDANKVISIVGVRRSGKTYYFFQKIKQLLQTVPRHRILYINFADDRLYPVEVGDLHLLLEAYFELYPHNKSQRIFLFLDEIQEIKEWERFVRRVYDNENARIFVTGSSSKLLHREISSALRGRTLKYELLPLSFSEFLLFKGIAVEDNVLYSEQRFIVKHLFEEYLTFGGFPEVVLGDLKREILDNYLELILYRDVVERYTIRQLSFLKYLIRYLLTNVANPFSIARFTQMARQQVAVNRATVSEYLSYLEDANLIFPVWFFSYSLKQQQTNPRKMYCIDTGLRNSVAFKFSSDEGRLVENMVFLHLKRLGNELYYWKQKQEVDFVMQDADRSLVAINVSYTDDVSEREFRGLIEFARAFEAIKGLFLLTRDRYEIRNVEGYTIRLVPVWYFLLQPRKCIYPE